MPPVVRATDTRAYPVYVASEAFCAPAAVGSAVCRAQNKFVSGDDAALSAILAIAVALKISFSSALLRKLLLPIFSP
jgi:hypothetical protein